MVVLLIFAVIYSSTRPIIFLFTLPCFSFQDLQQKLAYLSENQSLMQEKEERLEKADENVKALQEQVQEFKREMSAKNKHSKKQENETIVDLRRQVMSRLYHFIKLSDHFFSTGLIRSLH